METIHLHRLKQPSVIPVIDAHINHDWTACGERFAKSRGDLVRSVNSHPDGPEGLGILDDIDRGVPYEK